MESHGPARLIAGILYNDFVQEEKRKSYVDRYDEFTGESYKKEIVETRYIVGSLDFSAKEWEVWDGSECGLEFFFMSGDGSGLKIVGRELGKTKSYQSGIVYAQIFSLSEIQNLIQKVQGIFSNLEINKEVKLYFIQNIS